MPQGNGGVLGPANDPTSSTATGVWGLKEHAEAVGADSWPIPIPAKEIPASLRFNASDSAYLTRRFATGDRRTWTLSLWTKQSFLTGNPCIFGTGTGGSNYLVIYLRNSPTYGTIQIQEYNGAVNFEIHTSAVFRDPSAWMHLMFVLDTPAATNTDRLKLYVNGELYTGGTSALTYPSQNYQGLVNSNITHTIGRLEPYGSYYYTGNITEVNFVDGQALTPSSFGEVNAVTGVWKPITYTGSYGTNGFHLAMANNDGADGFGIGLDTSSLGLNRVETGNASYGVTVLGTMTYSGAGASDVHLRDNNSATPAADGVGLGSSTWMGYDFGRTIAIRKIRTITDPTYGSTYNATFNIQYSDDGSSWTTVSGATTQHSVTSGTSQTNETTFDDNGSHRYWRLARAYTGGDPTGGNFWIGSLDMYAYNIGPNSWWPVNLSVASGVGNDYLVDSPTQYGTDTGAGGEVRGNYCTLNPLDNGGLTLNNGNISASRASTAWVSCRATMGMTTGKWYWEYSNLYVTTVNWAIPGISTQAASLSQNIGTAANSWAYYYDGTSNTGGSASVYGATWNGSDIIGVSFDADAGTLVFYKNGVSQGTAFSGLTSGPYFPALAMYGTLTSNINFGQRPFAYTAPSGFKALCTTNLPDPTVVQGDDHFNTVLYTGNSTTNRAITGVGFAPDFTWIKARSSAYHHVLQDAVRGAGAILFSNLTNAEDTSNGGGSITSFDSDGFTLVNGTVNNTYVNNSGTTYAAWNWKGNGAGSSNTDGSITSTVSVNQTAGFSIVSYTGTGSAGTVGHGLGVAPDMVIVKSRSQGTGYNWAVYHSSIPATQFLRLNTTDSVVTASTVWNNTAPTSSVFSIGSDSAVSGSGQNFISYCFAEIPGYSAFGSYLGSTDLPFIYTGFRPSFILIKPTDLASNWYIYDYARSSYNVADERLFPDTSGAETTTAGNDIDFLSNGVKIRGSSTSGTNYSGKTFIYMAFSENPFKYALAR